MQLERTILDPFDLMDWIQNAPGEFHVSDLTTNRDLQSRYIVLLERLLQHGYIERVGRRRGWYRRPETGLEPIDYLNASSNPVDIWLPFDLSDKIAIYPGNVIIVAGAPNAGKSAILFNIIKENRQKYDTHYFSSEMDGSEMQVRLKNFDDIAIDQWGFKAYRRSADFHDVVFDGEGVLNVIDFLETHDEFYKIGGSIKKIHNALNGAIAVIALQKNPNQATGLGGMRTIEVTRLALSIDKGWPYNKCRIAKAKNTPFEIDGQFCEFKLVAGARLIPRNPTHGFEFFREERDE